MKKIVLLLVIPIVLFTSFSFTTEIDEKREHTILCRRSGVNMNGDYMEVTIGVLPNGQHVRVTITEINCGLFDIFSDCEIRVRTTLISPYAASYECQSPQLIDI